MLLRLAADVRLPTSANSKLLLPLIKAFARNPQLAIKLADIGACGHSLNRCQLNLATEPPPRIVRPHWSS
ncbi:hypothetical protein AJ87_20925 [Rhizobium yanglingense]|nr:hypothetical protein AJ87_20925 [Rhizobium yanglingense]